MMTMLTNIYEKARNPSSRNDKHYRGIFISDSSSKVRRTKTKFKTVTALLKFADRFNKRCNKV